MVTDEVVKCKHCNNNLCYKQIKGSYITYSCLTCGFQTNSLMKKGEKFYEEQLETLPEIYKDLQHTDEEGLIWIPQYVKISSKGIIYIHGTNPSNVQWVGVKEIPIAENERKKYPIPNKKNEYYKFRTDMSTLKGFGPYGFLEAITYVNNN